MQNNLKAPNPAPIAAQVAPAGTPGAPGLGIVVAVVLVAALYYGREVLIPITIAVLLSFLLTPLVELLRRVWLGRILSVVLAVILALGIIVALSTAIGTQMAHLAKNVPQYQTTIQAKFTSFRDSTLKKFSGITGRLGFDLSPIRSPAPVKAGAGLRAPQERPVPVVVKQPNTPLQIAERVLSPIMHPLATAGIVLVVTIFTLLQKEDLRDRAIRLLGGDLHRMTVAMNDAARRLSRYYLTQLGINASFGVIVGVGLFFIGVPNAVLWGLLGALLRFIPYIGSWIAATLPVALAAAVAPGWWLAIWAAVLYAGAELTMGQVVEPLLYGHSTGLSPLAVIVAAIFWTSIWGPIGLIISTPLTLCLVVLGRYIERLKFLDVLLGDGPPLTPEETFYQRLLADEPDEAEEQAERYLKDRPLSSYYDEVALKGLQLAANDVAAGVLTGAKVEHLKEAIEGLISDLDAYDDVTPIPADQEKIIGGSAADQKALPNKPTPAGDTSDQNALPRRARARVVCLVGRGPLDEAAASMLAQLLRKHGMDARLVLHNAVSRTSIRSLIIQDATMICISYLDISGNPAHLRYLLKRLREHLPKVQTVVGLWPAQDPILKDAHLRQAVGADYYVSTLHDAVEACLAAVHQDGIPELRSAPI